MAIDFDLCRSEDAAGAHPRVHRRRDHPARARSAPDAARADRGAAPRADRARAARPGLLSPHVVAGIGRPRARSPSARRSCSRRPAIRRSGPIALNIFAPDEGNMHLLEAVATPAQKERWLRPLAAGDDPLVLLHDRAGAGRGLRSRRCCTTTAVRDGDDYVINGAQVVHHRRRRRGVRDHHGASSKTAARRCSWPTWTRPGIAIERAMDTLDTCFPGGHGVVRFDDLRVPAADVLGEAGQGFRYAQVRLSPARLTHCMRWLGAARRAHDIAVDYARAPAGLRQAARRARRRRLHARRQRDGPARRAARDLALRVGARPGRARHGTSRASRR